MNSLETLALNTTDAYGASAAAIQSHYDVSNEFYRLWLDETMTYSCAFWEEADDLHSAQLKKIDLHLSQARARAAATILDIGCGWGSLLNRAVDHFEVKHAVGLTLSEAQHKWIQDTSGKNVEVRMESWEEHVPVAPYAAIVSIGAFEHFIKPGMKKEEKVRVYRRFFEWCHANSVEDSWLSLQSIVYENFDETEPNDFVKEIFPESDLPRLAEIVEAMQGLYEIAGLRNDREHYARTLQVWLSRLRSNRAAAIAAGGEALYRKYEKYLGIFVIGFHVGTVNLARIAARRISR